MIGSKALTIGDLGVDGSIFSDLYKDIYGMRPRFFSFKNRKEFDSAFKQLAEQAKEDAIERAKIYERNADDLDFMIENLQQDHTIDRATAIRWLIEAENLDPFDLQDREQFYFNMGLSWTEIKRRMDYDE